MIKAARRWPCDRDLGILQRATITCKAASLASTLALALAGLAETRSPAQTLNATSHWLHGEAAGAVRRADWPHTALGYATHHAATLFWALLFERWIARRRPLSPASMAAHALALSVFAAAVDYGATPKRFTPGWELVLSKRAMAAAYLALATGLAMSGLAVQGARPLAGPGPGLRAQPG